MKDLIWNKLVMYAKVALEQVLLFVKISAYLVEAFTKPRVLEMFFVEGIEYKTHRFEKDNIHR
jgi:hypothetical protein